MSRAVWLSLFLVACGPPPVELPDASVEDSGVVVDAGLEDAGVEDSGVTDAGTPDAGADDAGLPDAGVPDAGQPDAGFDAGVADSGIEDAGVVDAGPPGCPVPTGSEAPFTLRAVAANLTSGNGQDYNLGHGTRIMRGLVPDIVMIQEFSYQGDSTADFNSYVASNFGPEFTWFRGVGNIPNGIISRWQIVDQGEWNGEAPDRELTWAKVDLPGPHDLFVISVHFLTSNASDRNLDARTIMNRLDAGVSPYDYVLLGGDFNTNTTNENAFNTLSPRFKTSMPHPVDQRGNPGTNANRDKPYDQVLASTCLAGVQIPTVVGAASFPGGLVVDTRVFADAGTLADIAPALAGDSAAPSMQHMAVVKDFLISP